MLRTSSLFNPCLNPRLGSIWIKSNPDLMSASIEEGYHKGFKAFDRELTMCLDENQKNQVKQ